MRRSIIKLSLAALLLPSAACVADNVITPPEASESVDEGAPDVALDTDDSDPAGLADGDTDPSKIEIPEDLADPQAATEPRFLPAYQTEEEKANAPLVPLAASSSPPPAGVMQWPYPEYGKSTGVLIRAQDYTGTTTATYFGKLIKAVIAAGAKPILLEPNAAGVTRTKTKILAPAGISAASVQFEVSPDVNTVWTRDYAPWYVYVNNKRASVDVRYFPDPDRAGDDRVPLELAAHWNEDVYSAPVYTEGGNFMTDGFGTCWASERVLLQNSHLSESAVRAHYQDYANCATVNFIPPIPNEGTGHIDMFSKVLDQDTILVGYSNAGFGAQQAEIDQLEAAAVAYANTPKPGGGTWYIERVPMRFGSDAAGRRVYYTHTNSLIVNKTVLVPTYGNAAIDQVALDTYRTWMPLYNVVGIDANSVITMGGAIHCTTMQVPPTTFATCGDGVVSSAEECEPNNLRWATCDWLGYQGGGKLSCRSDCRYDTTKCVGPRQTCGNGVKEGSEVCDGGSIACGTLGAGVGVAFCQPDCSAYNTNSCITLPPLNCTASACQSTPGLAIPDADPAGVSSTISVGSFTGWLRKVKVTADITHTYQGDLQVALTSPNGVVSFLHAETGGSEDDLHLSLELDDFAGGVAIGDWKLEVSDGFQGDVGTLNRWSLQLMP